MKHRKNRFRIFLAMALTLGALASAYAVSSYLDTFNSTYKATSTDPIRTCSVCHSSSGPPARNPYGAAFAGAGRSFSSIESLDSDGDGFTNIQEILAGTYPGDPSSHPSTPPSDTTAPTVTAFTIPGTSTTLTVAITSLTATDSVGVTGYMVKESATAPASGATGWTASPPTSFTFGTAGAKTLHAWAKDAAGNVSASRSETTTITLPPAPDTMAPTVTAFTIPATSSTLTVAITSLTATDNVGVTGYIVKESATAPAAGATGWTASPPNSFTFGTAGSKTLYAWAKDAAGNVSASRSATTTITMTPGSSDTTAPTVTAFTIPATANSLTLPINVISASDNVGVTGYRITESATAPGASASGWTASPPTSFTFGTAGAKTLYAWAKDAAGNVSASRSATTTITTTSGSGPDKTAPLVTVFAIAETSSSLTVPVTSLTAMDAIGVTGYVVTESATAPASNATGWMATPPTSFTFTTAGTKTLHAWAKDGAGNISTSRSATTTITLSGTPPADLSIWTNKWFKVKINRHAERGSDDESDDESERAPQDESDDGPDGNAYLKIRSWDPEQQILGTTLFTSNGKAGGWTASDLQFHYTSGGPLRFLFWFDSAGEFQFSAALTGSTQQGTLARATLKSAGIYLAKSADVSDDETVSSLSFNGPLIPESKVPVELLNQ